MSVLSMDERDDPSSISGSSGNDNEDAFAQLLTLPEEISTKRQVCARCKRPLRVCICSCFPDAPLPIQSRVIILQHPHEESRSLATVPLLKQCLPADRLSVIRGKRFGPEKALRCRNTIILYPGKYANDISSLPRLPVGLHDDAAVIAIDGTWSQAKGLYYHNPRLHDATQVQLNVDEKSAYVIRTQPTKSSLSTLECVAHALTWLENDNRLVEALVRPLHALCQHQLQHGAVEHHSKDNPEYVSRSEMKLRMKEKAREISGESGVPP